MINPFSALKNLGLGKLAWVAIGAGTTLFLGLSAGLAYQTHQVGEWRDAATILNESYASELAQTQHLRAQIAQQNDRIDALAAEARAAADRATDRAREVQQRRARAVAQSEGLDAGPEAMNSWLAQEF